MPKSSSEILTPISLICFNISIEVSKEPMNQFYEDEVLKILKENGMSESEYLDSITLILSKENQKISDNDFEKLRLSAGELDPILSTPDSQVPLEKNARSAIIADVHTDAVTGKILYEADGIPNYISGRRIASTASRKSSSC